VHADGTDHQYLRDRFTFLMAHPWKTKHTHTHLFWQREEVDT